MATPSARLLTIASFANLSSSASASSTSTAKPSQRRMPSKLARHVLVVSLFLVVIGAALPSWATTYTVTSTTDSGTGSLRAALGLAADGDTINFSLAYPATITLTSGQLTIGTSVTISGPGAANLFISGARNFSVFKNSATATISGVTIENGFSPLNFGGAIANYGTLTVSDSTLSGNSAFTSLGGGIFNYGGCTLTVINSTFSGNSANGGGAGGGIYNGGTATVINSTFSGNSASTAGAIYNYGSLTVSFSTFSGNSATAGAYGGAIANLATLTLKSTLLAGQTAGGNCYLDGGTASSDGYDLSDDSSCTFLTATGDQNDVTNAATYLGPLANNGGPTSTIALLAGSPGSTAIDAIPLSACTDAFGNPVITDQRGITRPQGTNCDIGAFELEQTPTANVCPNGQTSPAPCSDTITVQYQVPQGTTLGANSVQVLTQGAPNLDFTLANTTCTGTPGYCYVRVKFAPIAPGLRQGAVQLYDNNNNLLFTTLLRGISSAPQLVFPGAAQVTVNNGWYPDGVATDAAGNVYFTGYPGGGEYGYVIVIPPGCSNSSCYKQWGSGWRAMGELAVDGAGNSYVPNILDPVSTFIVPPGCTSTACETTVGNVGAPSAVALDGAGDVFIGNESNGGSLTEFYALGGQTTVGSGEDSVLGVALDTAGDAFITSCIAGTLEVPVVGTQSDFASWLGGAVGVTVDAAGDVYLANSCGSSVTEVPLGCTSSACDIAVGTGYGFIGGMALDNAGDLFLGDGNNGPLYEIPRSRASSLSFGSIQVNDSSTPQTVTVQNIGNQPLNFASFSFSTNFGPASVTNPCSTSSPLAVGALCNVGVVFSPLGTGSLSGTLTLTDNALNASSATQTITLQGVGTPLPAQVSASPSSVAFGNIEECPIRKTVKQLVTLIDNGTTNVPLIPSDISFIDVTGHPSDFTSHLYCDGFLGPKKGHSCSVAVEFSPSELEPESATLNIVTNAPGSPVQVPITGTGVAGPKCKSE